MSRSFSYTDARKRRIAAAVACVSVLALVAVELGVRTLGIAPQLSDEYGYFVHDPALPYRTAPSATFSGRSRSDEFDYEFVHNARGFRDRDRSLGRAPGVFRILALGDSFTYGAGAAYEDTYLRRLERRLNESGSARSETEIIKAGIPRYFPEPERMLLERYGMAYTPDVVLIGFTPNDVMDTYMGLEAVAVDASGYLKTAEATLLGSPGAFLYLNSHAARVVLTRYLGYRRGQRHTIDWPQVFVADGLYEKAWDEIEAELTRIVAIARAGGARPVLVHIPISPSDTAYFGIDDVSYPASRLRVWARRERVLFVDVLPAMEAAATSRSLYWEKDSHPNADGYAVIADTIYEALTEAGAVPR